MAWFKKIGNVVGAIALVSLFLGAVVWTNYRELVHPYRWDNQLTETLAAEGFEVVNTLRAGDLVLPWTWFRPPVVTITFAHPSQMVRYGDKVYAWTVTAYYSQGRSDESINVSVVDCSERQLGLLDDVPDQTPVSTLRNQTPDAWIQAPQGHMSYFCNQ